MKWGVLTPDTTYELEADDLYVNQGSLVFTNTVRVESGRDRTQIVRVFAPGAYLQAWPVEESGGPASD